MSTETKLRKDLQTLATFVEIFCANHHDGQTPVVLRSHNVEEIVGKPLSLCPNCAKILAHAWVKRSLCPMNPKPACKHCPNHCYAPAYRQQMRQVMRYSGKRLLLTGRIDYLLKFLF